MEHGQGLDVGRIPELAAALQCTVTYLLGLTMDPHRWEPDEEPAQPKLGRPRTGRSQFVPDEEPLEHSPARETARVSGA
jgi:hypothetical protein